MVTSLGPRFPPPGWHRPGVLRAAPLGLPRRICVLLSLPGATGERDHWLPVWVARARQSTALQAAGTLSCLLGAVHAAASTTEHGLDLSHDTFPGMRQVTIPPPGWINAAHTHGVRVLGTLITEWEAGAAACAQLFGSADAAAATAHALARIAACYGFEGWLVNIENEVQPGHIPNLLHFLR